VKGKLDTAERIQALVTGPPAYVLRRKRMEDIEASILRSIRSHEAKTGARLSFDSPPVEIRRSLALLHQLIRSHNAYYPIEASLPIDSVTGALLDWGKRWTPLPLPTLEELVARAGPSARPTTAT
jgi:hypothetical protein